MRLSEDARRKFSAFFETHEITRGISIPDVQIYARRGAWLVTTAIMVDGITLGRHIFINPRFVKRDAGNILRAPKDLIAHELVHVIQYQRHGFMRFLKLYVNDFWESFKKLERWTVRGWFESYLEIEHEEEARKIAAEFMRWTKNPESK